MNWLVVADDDTLLNIEQLQKVINCLPTTKAILGERYGFGFDSDGIGGYSYPTGGSSFVMSRETARFIAHSCECPHVNSADDMIIGCKSFLLLRIKFGDFSVCQTNEHSNSSFTSLSPGSESCL